MIGAVEAYKTYVAVKNHFINPKYDFFKYHGKIRISANTLKTFETKNYSFKYSKLGKLMPTYDDLVLYLAINMFENTLWIDSLLSDECSTRYNQFVKTSQSLTYTFESEMNRLLDQHKFSELFAISDVGYPIIVKELLGKRISLHTFLVLDDCVGLIDRLDKKLSSDIFWKDQSDKLKKVRPFVKFDKKKMRTTLKKVLEDHI